MPGDAFTLDLARCKDAVLRKLPAVLLAALAGFAGALALTFGGLPHEYAAETTLYSVAGAAGFDEAQQATAAMLRYAGVATSRKVLAETAAFLGQPGITGEALEKMVRVRTTESSSLLTIEARLPSEELAVAAANKVAALFLEEMATVTGGRSARVLDAAETAVLKRHGPLLTWGVRLLAALAAALVACLAIALGDALSGRVRTAADAALGGQLPVVAAVPDYRKKPRGRR